MRGLILSAGLGERLRPLTLTRAKPAVEFLNMPMLAFPYHWLSTLGLTDVTFNTHYLPNTVRHAAMHVARPELGLHFSHEPAILGSGGGIWNARFNLIGDRNGELDFAVANGDGVVLCPDANFLVKMRDAHVAEKALATVLVCPLEGVGYKFPGVWFEKMASADVTAPIVNFGKAGSRTGLTCQHYASYMIMNRRILDRLPEGPSNILYDVLEPLIRAGERVRAFPVHHLTWFETGNVADYLSATGYCLGLLRERGPLGLALESLLEKFGPGHQRQSDWGRLRLVADTANIDVGVTLEGFSVVGSAAHIGRGAKLTDCVVLPGARIPDGEQRRSEVIE